LAVGLLAAPAVQAGWEEGQAAYAAGNYEEAITEFRGVVGDHPQYAPGHYMLGLSLYRMEQLDEALTSFSTAIEMEPDNPHFRVALARALVDRDRNQEAFDALNGLDYGALPESLRRGFVQLLATAASRAGRAGEAVTALQAAAAANPDDADLWFALGQARTSAADDVGAFEAFVKVSELEPEHAAACRRAAEAAMRIGDAIGESADRASWYRWGADYADKAAALEATAEHQLLAGRAWSGAGETATAEQWFARAVETAPDSALAWYELGRARSAADRDDEAMQSLERALALSDNDAMSRNVMRAMAYALRKQQRFEDAKRLYTELGDSARVAEMERLAELAQQNLEADAAVQDCLSRWESLQGLMERNRHLEGSPAWDAIAEQERQIRAECGEVLGL
jgi:superkiller protein 3